MTLEERFEQFDNDRFGFGSIENKLSRRPDVHAFILLDSIVEPEVHPTGFPSDIIACAEHDEIWLDVDCDGLNEKITNEQILQLVRCGVRYDSDVDSLTMYV